MPVVQSPGGDVLQVTGDVASLTLDGLVLAGGNVTIGGASPLVSLRFCSLDPQTSGIAYSPTAAGAQLNLTNVITGPVVTSANVASVILNGCAVQRPARRRRSDDCSCRFAGIRHRWLGTSRRRR